MDMFKENKIVPVIVLKKLEDTIPTLTALKNGGIKIAEITFRTACAKDAISLAVKEFPDMIIGAGTVVNDIQCVQAIECGARFIVGPGFSESVAKVCKNKGVLYVPGCVTPSEIIQALEYDIKTIKFFPADAYGGIKTLKALAAPFPQIRFIPTGGIDENNLIEYLAFDKVEAVGGSWMCKGTPEEIEEKSRKAVGIVNNI